MKSCAAIYIQCIGVALMAFAGPWAAEVWASAPVSAPETVFGTQLHRSTWDLALNYLNFIILAALILKYARKPLRDFLHNEKAKTVQTLALVEEQKRLAEEKIREGQMQLQASQSRLDLIKKRIVAEGEQRREKMIAEAQEESRLMLATARIRIEHQIREAHHAIRSELIDTAFESALRKLPQKITDTDQRALIQSWVNEAQRVK